MNLRKYLVETSLPDSYIDTYAYKFIAKVNIPQNKLLIRLLKFASKKQLTLSYHTRMKLEFCQKFRLKDSGNQLSRDMFPVSNIY